MTTPLEAAKAKFPPGTLVELNPRAIVEAAARNTDWNQAEWLNPCVVRVAAYRGSADDPLVCLCVPSVTGAVCGWFNVDQIRIKP